MVQVFKNGFPRDVTFLAYRPTKTKTFAAKRLFLIFFLTISLVQHIATLYEIDRYQHPYEALLRHPGASGSKTAAQMEVYNLLTRNIFVSFLAIGIALESVSLYGLVKQNVCLSAFYTLLMSIMAVAVIMAAANRFTIWLDALISTLVALTAFSYVRDLRKMQENRIEVSIHVI